MMVLFPGSLTLGVEMLETAEVLEVEASEGIGLTTERLAMSALGLDGGAAMFRGSNLDLFSAAPAVVVEGRFLLSREAMFSGKLNTNRFKRTFLKSVVGVEE